MFSDSFATPWTVACHALLSMGFFRQEYLNGLPFPPPGDLPDSGIKPRSPVPPELLGQDRHIHTIICKTDNQQGPTV